MGSSMFLLSMTFKPWTPLFIVIALLVGLSRIYLGLHYPSDVLSGYAFGLLIGYLVWGAIEKLKLKITVWTKADRRVVSLKSNKRVNRG
jgi:membrane-associated phospholipid phosphatase